MSKAKRAPSTVNAVDRDQAERVRLALDAHPGRENCVPLARLAVVLDISPRDVQAIVKYLVEECAEPIGTAVSHPFGYYRIVREAELEANYRHFIRRGLSNIKHARAYRSSSMLAPIIGQLEIEVGGEGDTTGELTKLPV